VHADEAATEYEPAGQAVHVLGDSAPVVPDDIPAAQVLHVVAPALA
jgi:hypothetical protein